MIYIRKLEKIKKLKKKEKIQKNYKNLVFKIRENSLEINDVDVSEYLEKIEKFEMLYNMTLSDFENYKKRQSREIELHKFNIYKKICLGFIEILEDFYRIKKSFEQNEGLMEYSIGIQAIINNFENELKKYEVTEIKDFSEFNPEIHQVIETVEDNTRKNGEILEILRKGYVLKEKVIRPAMIKINKI